MVRNLLVFLVAAGACGQTPAVLEARKRVKELSARTYIQCGTNDFRLVEDRSGPGGSQQFKIAEYRNLSHLIDILVDDPAKTDGLEYRGVFEHSCAQKRIYALSRSGAQWRGQWSHWAPCGKLDPENPFVLAPDKAGEPTVFLKRAGVWSIVGARHNDEPRRMTCEDVPPAAGDWNTWLAGFLKRRGSAAAR